MLVLANNANDSNGRIHSECDGINVNSNVLRFLALDSDVNAAQMFWRVE